MLFSNSVKARSKYGLKFVEKVDFSYIHHPTEVALCCAASVAEVATFMGGMLTALLRRHLRHRIVSFGTILATSCCAPEPPFLAFSQPKAPLSNGASLYIQFNVIH